MQEKEASLFSITFKKNNNMKINFTLIIITLFFQTINAQVYNPAPYCNPLYSAIPCNIPGASNAPGNTANDFINSFYTIGANTNISNLNSGCNGQSNCFVFNCQHNLSVTAGQVITCSVQSGNTYSQGISIFIDWNKNNVYNIPSELAGSTPNAPGGGTWSTINFTVPAAQANGIYRMRVRSVRNINGNNSDPCAGYLAGEAEEYNIYVGIPIPSVITVTASSNSTICANQTLSLSLNYTGTATLTYNWTGPNSFTSTLKNPVIPNAQPNAGGIYFVTIFGAQCPITSSLSVGVGTIQAPLIQATSNTSLLCIGDSAILTANGAVNYTWSPGGFGQTIKVSPTVTTTYLVASDNGTCVGSAAITQSVQTCTGLNTNSLLENKISIYPNPFKNELTIKVQEKAELKLCNSLGETILQKSITVEEIINTEFLSKGIYYLSIKIGGNEKVEKIIKN